MVMGNILSSSQIYERTPTLVILQEMKIKIATKFYFVY